MVNCNPGLAAGRLLLLVIFKLLDEVSLSINAEFALLLPHTVALLLLLVLAMLVLLFALFGIPPRPTTVVAPTTDTVFCIVPSPLPLMLVANVGCATCAEVALFASNAVKPDMLLKMMLFALAPFTVPVVLLLPPPPLLVSETDEALE